MADFVRTAAKLYTNEYDASGDLSDISLITEADAVEKTTYGSSGVREFLGGLRRASFSASGYLDYAASVQDAVMFPDLGAAVQLVTIAPETGNDGDLAYVMNEARTLYTPGGEVGGMAAFSINGQAAGDCVRGTIMTTGAQTGNGPGTARQLGAVAAAESVYAGLHVIAWNATTLDVVVDSDDNSGMTSATERIAFAQNSAVGSEFVELAGAITDDWWRVDWTLVGTSATFVVVVGIL